MKFVPTVLALLVLIAAPAAAADRTFEVAGWYVWLDPSSEGTFQAGDPPEDFDVNFDAETGYGVSAILFLGNRLSLEAAVSQVTMPLAIAPRGRVANLRAPQASLIPVSGTLQFHLAPNAMIDPYIGVGAMYLLFGDLTGGNADNLAIDEVESDDIGYLVNLGVNVELTEQFGLLLDAKYVPSANSARVLLNDEQGTETTIRMSPIVVSLGLSYRF